jgi:hypothetical protein
VPSPDPKRSARQRSVAFRAAQRRAERRRRLLIWAISAVVVAAAVVGITAATQSGSARASATRAGATGPEGIALEQGQQLASAGSAATGQTVDGIQCDANEQVAYHVHAHLSIYVNGALRPIPAGIGIVTPVVQSTANGSFDSASRCYYWLHVHAQDGVIHVESPTTTTYTLGQFFAIWNQPLTADQVGPSTGTLTVFVNGVRYTGDPAAIPLKSHADIQIDVGTPTVAAQPVDWSKSQL